MFNLTVREVMDPEQAHTVPPDASVSVAAVMMAQHNIGAAMVVSDDRLVGIFTERDALYRVIARGLDPRNTPVAEVMTANPLTIEPGKTYGYALMLMQDNGFRHVPVVEGGKPVGMVSSRNAMDPDLEEFASEVQRRKHLRDER